MSWQRWARWGVALAGVGTAAALFVYTRPRPPAASAPKPTATVDPTATAQSSGGVDVQYIGTTERYRLEHHGYKTFADGHVELEGVHLVFKDDGTEAWADQAIIKRGPKETQAPAALDLKGHVRLKTGEGATVEGESATYDDATGFTNIPGPVTFSRGRMSGTGEGATYERDTGVFRLLAHADVSMGTDAANPDPIDAQADTLVFNRATRAMQFDAHVRITRAAEAMTADRATLYLSEDEQWFRLIELRGKSRVQPLPGKKSDTPTMRAEDIDLAFYDGTQVLSHGVLTRQASLTLVGGEGPREVSGDVVDFDLAHDGSTVTRLNADKNVEVKMPATATAPQRQITGAQLSGTGDEKNGLTKAVFTGGIRFVETTRAAAGRAASTRTGRSQTLTLTLKGQLDAIDEALFQRDAVFSDGEVEGRADVGRYLESAGKLVLQPDAAAVRRAPPHVTHGSNTVDATDRIEVMLDSNDLYAFGDVKTTTVSSTAPGGKPRPASLFNGTDPVYGFAAEFHYADATGLGVYLGSARAQAELHQGDSTVKADSVRIVDSTQDMEASGHVHSSFVLLDSVSKTETRYELTGDTMDYKDATRVATYVGKPAELRTVKRGDKVESADTLGQTIVLTLAPDSRTVDTLDARTDVYSTMGEGQEAQADTLRYESRIERYTLTGKAGRPLVIRSRDANGKCSETKDALFAYFTNGDNTPIIPEGRNPAGSKTTGIPCGGSLRP